MVIGLKTILMLSFWDHNQCLSQKIGLIFCGRSGIVGEKKKRGVSIISQNSLLQHIIVVKVTHI